MPYSTTDNALIEEVMQEFDVDYDVPKMFVRKDHPQYANQKREFQENLLKNSVNTEKAKQLLQDRLDFKPEDEHANWKFENLFPQKEGNKEFYTSYMKDIISDISRLDTGKALLRSFLAKRSAFKAQNTTASSKLRILFSAQKQMGFDTKNDRIDVNMWGNNRLITQKDGKYYAYTIGGLLKSRLATSHGTSSSSSSETHMDNDHIELVEVGPGLTPFYISFAHELMHAERYYRNKEEFSQAGDLKDPYADKFRKKTLEISPNAEENRTVISPNDFSELLLRKEAKERIRYLYHNFSDSVTYYEPKSTIIKKIFQSYYRKDLNLILSVMKQDKVSENIKEQDIMDIIDKLPIKPLPVDKKISDDYTINSSSNDAFEGVSASATSIAPMPEHVKQGIIYTQFRELPKLYKRYRSIDIASDIIRDLSAIYEKNPNSFTNSVGNRIHPAISIVQERMNRSDYLVKALDYVNKVKKDTIDINEVIRKKEPEHQWIIRAIAKKRISPDNFVSSTSFSPSSSSSSSSDMPLPSITAKTENIKEELARKLARAVYTKIMLEHNYIGEKSNNIYKPSAYAVTEGIRRLTQNLKQISTSTVKPMSLEQFKKLMHFYSNNDAIEHRRKMVNVVTKWYLKYGHSLFPKT